MKAERLLSALLLLQAHGCLTGRELAERLEVSERTIHRDMEALSMSGIPIAAIRGAQGGWQLEKGWRTQVPGLDASELNALLMTQPRALGDPRLAAAAESAFGKLMGAMPGAMRQRAAAIRERLHIDATGWHPSTEDLSMLAEVQEAVSRDCKLAFDYTRADGQKSARTVDPLGLVSKGTTWYLVARTVEGMRTFRVSRMQSVTPLAIPFERPPRFDLAEYWKESIARLGQQRQQYEAILFLDPQASESLLRWSTATPIHDKPHPPKGWQKFRISFESPEQARFVALGFGSRAIVAEPEELRKRIFAEVTAVATRNNLVS